MQVGDILEVTLMMHAQKQAGVVVLHYRADIVVGPDQLNDVAYANGFDNVFHAAFKATMHNSATWRGTSFQRILPLPKSLRFLSSTANQGPGTIAGILLPKQTSGVIAKKTNFAGRRFRGRSFIPFPGDSVNTTEGRPNGPYQANLATIAALMVTQQVFVNGAQTTTFTPVVLSRTGGHNTTITVCVPRPRWGTQRRRGDFGREQDPVQ